MIKDRSKWKGGITMKDANKKKGLKKPVRKNSAENTVQVYSAEGPRLAGKISW